MYRNPAEQRLGQLRAELVYTDTRQIIARGLHEFLDGFHEAQSRRSIDSRYFFHSPPDRFRRADPRQPITKTNHFGSSFVSFDLAHRLGIALNS
jgi:A predicted alpha-helical domain with a conserved ER motif.